MNFYNAGKKEKHGNFIQQSNQCKKPIEIYVFIDPLCPECWALEPSLKKLYLQYGDYFKVKHVLCGNLTSLNALKRNKPSNLAEVWERTASRSGMSCDGDLWFDDPISSPFSASIAIKAAELQGKKIGLRFLRKLQESLFIEKQNITKEEVLIQIAEETCLDIVEFKRDLHSESASRAFQCDLAISCEMGVEESPTIVFFNENIEDEGLKVTGYYPYEIYVDILSEMLQQKPTPKELPDLVEFLKLFRFVASKEISVVYDWSEQEVEHNMKKLMLKQLVEHVPVKYGHFWRYIGE